MITEIVSEGDSFALEWNKRSAQMFPSDMLRVGDVIVCANEADTPTGIIDVMKVMTVGKIFVVARIESGG